MKKFMLFIAGMLLPLPLYAAEPAGTMEAETAAMAPAAAEATQLAGGSVARAIFTNGVSEREPIDAVNSLTNDQTKIYYFTELRDMAGQTVTHRWEYNGKVLAEVPFEVGGNRWRVFSSKNLEDVWLGEWKVSVIDQSGGTLSVNTFSYLDTPASTAEPAAAAAPAAPKATEAQQ